MLLEAKHQIELIMVEVEKKVKSDMIALEKVRELKEKVNTSMTEYNSLQKWNNYKSTDEYNKILIAFNDSAWEQYPEMALASAYFQRPCFFNED